MAEVEKKISPFDFIKSINMTKENLLEKGVSIDNYNSYLTNKSMSHFLDTLFYADEMNQRSNLEPEMQYLFYLHAIPKRTRWSKWHKKDVVNEEELVKFLMEYFSSSREVILQNLKSITEEKKQELIREYLNEKEIER